MLRPNSGRTSFCLRGAAGLLLIAGVATGCPGDDVTVGDETGGPTSTGDEPTTSPGTMSTTGVSASSSGPDTSSSGPTTLDTDTTGEPGSSTGDASSGETAEPTETSATTMVDESSSSSSESSTGEPPDQECPYGDLMVPDSVTNSTLGEDSEFSSSCGGNGAPDVSYTLTAPEDGVYVIDTAGSAIDTIIAVYDGECVGELIACNNDDPVIGPQSRVSVELMAGQTVTVVADGFAIGGGAVTINVAYFEGTCPNGDLGNTVPYSTSGSTMAGDNTLVGSCGGGTANDDAFTFTAPAAGTYSFDTEGSDFDTVLYLRDACDGSELACNDDGPVAPASSASLVLEAGEQVVVVVDGAGLESGNYDLNIELDVCPDADLGSTVPQTVMGSTVGGIDQAAGTCGLNGGSPDIAYTFTAPAPGNYIFDTFGSGFDTRLYVYDGSTCSGTQLACNDDSGGLQSQVVVALEQDQVVTVIVDGYNGASGAYTLNVDTPVCGNGSLDPFEECEGMDLAGETCASLGAGGGGVLACTAGCTFDTSGCLSCGDDIVNGSDVCDGYAIDATKCEDFGWAGGTIDCEDDCGTFDESECSNTVVAVCSQPGAAIDSAFPTTTDTLDVASMGTITDVDLFMDITHTYCGDLDISLGADDLGLSNTIVLDTCSLSNDAFVYFNDEGNGPPSTSCAEPFGLEGNVTPAQALSVYDGSEVNGSWTLTITDDAGGDIGTLNEWCLYFTLAP